MCPAMWMDHIYLVVVRPGRPHVDARASEADDWRASGAFGRRGSVLSVLVRARASVARGVEERARGHRPRDREIRAGVSEARARAVSSEMTSASASVRARWTLSAVARARGAGERRRGRGGGGVKAVRAATENESAVGEGTAALPTTSAVVSVGVSEERVKVDGKKPRSGMRRVFADERSLETPKEESKLRDFWYPVMFESKFNKEQEIEFDIVLFDETWVIRQVSEGEYACESKADSSKTLPTGVKDGLVMVWTGTCKTPSSELPSHFAPPSGYTIHAELIIDDVPVEHGLLMENLLDLAHAPFTHTGTFAKGWGVPNMVKFASRKLRKEGDGWHDMSNFLANGRSEGSWKPYPIDMKFLAPCMVDSHIGLSQAGAAGKGAQFEAGVTALDCAKHLHQLHVCLPSTPGHTRLLYRMSLDFASWARYVPGIEYIWTEMANQVLGEDLRLVTGQQDRMQRGGRVWAHPVAYDKLGLHYRRWRNVMDGMNQDGCAVE